MILTIIHHAYGAMIYEAPFRLHAVFFAVPVIIILLLTYRMYRKRSSAVSGKVAFWVFMVVTVLISVGMIGLFEGGYNHLVKNLLYFGGTSQATLIQLFPPPTYEMPNDFWFEATGILQFFSGVYCMYYLFRLWKEKSSRRLYEAARI
jgi:hypothetical protein